VTRPPGAERRPEPRQPLEVGVAARALVGEHRGVGGLHADDLGVEKAVLRRADRVGVRPQRPLVAFLLDAVEERHLLRSLTEAERGPASVEIGIRGLTKRHPSELSTTSPGLAQGRTGLAITQGARVIDSTPPAMTRSASPLRTVAAAVPTADKLLPHRRLTVMPGTESGSPASRAAIRATLRLSSPALIGRAQHHLIDVDAGHASPDNNPARTVAARSSGRTWASRPP